jgi:tetrahydromethanopterin S-methyltransferase subunit G
MEERMALTAEDLNNVKELLEEVFTRRMNVMVLPKFEAIDRRFDRVDQRFDRLEKRMDGWAGDSRIMSSRLGD